MSSSTGISRRAAIGYGALGAGVVGAGIFGVTTLLNQPSSGPHAAHPANTGGTATMPPVLRSSNGKLAIDLTAAMTTTQIDDKTAHLMTYNGVSPAPTWVVKPGDTITVNLKNALGEPTNLHTHGLHVSPAGDSDNVFRHIADGETASYTYELDADHPSGVFWYHPHMHGMTADQLFAGLYGAIIVEEPDAPETAVDRVLVVSDITLRNDGQVATPNQMSKMMGREGDLIMVNGQVAPNYTFTPNTTERWRIVNACASRYLDLASTGASMQLLGIDSGHYATPKNVSTFRLTPGNRADLLVSLGSGNAGLTYTTVPHPDSMGMGNTATYTNLPIATFSSGASAVTPALAPTFAAAPDLRKATLTGTRGLTLNMPGMGGGMMGGGGNGAFTINGNSFNMDIINEHAKIGAIEEWTIINASTMDHPFHLHVWPMQLMSVGGKAVEGVEYQDVVNVPAKSQSVVRINFDAFPGKTVYHCHILDHEDLGMMGVIEAS